MIKSAIKPIDQPTKNIGINNAKIEATAAVITNEEAAVLFIFSDNLITYGFIAHAITYAAKNNIKISSRT